MTDGFDDIGLPPLGHNRPPEPTAIERAAPLIETTNRWLAERPSITSTEIAEAAHRLTVLLREVRDALGLELKRERRPHDDAIAAIKLRYKDPAELIDKCLQLMELKNRDWLQREKARIDRERVERERIANEAIAEAARKQAEAETRGATVEAQLEAGRAQERAAQLTKEALSAPTRPRVKEEFMPRAMTLHANWKARVIDEGKALRTYAKHPTIRAAALAAIVRVAGKLAELQKGKPPVPDGIEFYNDERAQ